jgi:hypothetical protein
MTKRRNILRSETGPPKQEMFLLLGLPETRPLLLARRELKEFLVHNFCQFVERICTLQLDSGWGC